MRSSVRGSLLPRHELSSTKRGILVAQVRRAWIGCSKPATIHAPAPHAGSGSGALTLRWQQARASVLSWPDMAGEELLIADSVDRDGLRKLFEDAGFVCTAPPDIERAKELVRRKFFPVALIDFDFGGTGTGLDLARFVH